MIQSDSSSFATEQQVVLLLVGDGQWSCWLLVRIRLLTGLRPGPAENRPGDRPS